MHDARVRDALADFLKQITSPKCIDNGDAL